MYVFVLILMEGLLMGVPVPGCRGGVRIRRLPWHGKRARFNNFTHQKAHKSIIFASLSHSKRRFGMGFQRETYQQCKPKYKMRTKEKKKSEACWLCGLTWLLWLSLQFGSKLLGRHGQMGCVVNHTCGSKLLLLYTFSEDCGMNLSLSWFFWEQESPQLGEREGSKHIWNANCSACFLIAPLSYK